mmetsp:Transcript_53025/g.128652  ORF Transcript_53025/g.128652 Transcript_53025/m.128652 type:complete len:245 (-) Transcript_53025:1684-2418(-)
MTKSGGGKTGSNNESSTSCDSVPGTNTPPDCAPQILHATVGTCVGDCVGESDGDVVGTFDGDALGVRLGLLDGDELGEELGRDDGDALGLDDGDADGLLDGEADGRALGDELGDELGEFDGLEVGELDGRADGDADGLLDGCGVGSGVGSGVTITTVGGAAGGNGSVGLLGQVHEHLVTPPGSGTPMTQIQHGPHENVSVLEETTLLSLLLLNWISFSALLLLLLVESEPATVPASALAFCNDR